MKSSEKQMQYIVGQSLWYNEQKITIRRLFKNNKGVTIIEWESRHNIGAVMTTIWEEWRANVDPDVRRANEQCVCEPKPRNRQGRRRIAFGTKRRRW